MNHSHFNSRSKYIIQLIPEIILFSLVILSLIWVGYRFYIDGYLPQPYLFLQDDTWMDWFNPAYWSKRSGAYDIWMTVYPPLSFVFLDIFSLDRCYIDNSIFARDCDWLAQLSIMMFYVLSVILASLAFYKNDRKTGLLRSIAFALGLPLLFTLERGNLLLIALPFFILAHGSLKVPKAVEYFSIAVTVNLKPYLVSPVLAFAIKRKWRAAELAALTTILVYLASYAYVNAGSPQEIIHNTLEFLKASVKAAYGSVYYSTSYAPLLDIDKGFPIKLFVGSKFIEQVQDIIPLVIWSSLTISATSLVAAWLQPKVISQQRLAAIFMITYLVWQSPGGYALIFPVFLILLEKSHRIGPVIAVAAAYMLLISFDYIIAPIGALYRESWLSGYGVRNSFGISIGQFVRPGLLVIILWALCIDTISQFIRAHARFRPTLGLMLADNSGKGAA